MKGISSFARQRWQCPSSSHSCVSSLLAKPETQETMLRLPSLLPPTPSSTCAVFSELCSSNHPLSRITAAAPRPSLLTHLSAGRNSSVRFVSQPPALFESLGAFLLHVRKLLTGPGGQARSLRPALPTLLASPLQPLRSQNQGLRSSTCNLFSFLSQTQSHSSGGRCFSSQFRYLPCDPHTARPVCYYPFIYM